MKRKTRIEKLTRASTVLGQKHPQSPVYMLQLGYHCGSMLPKAAQSHSSVSPDEKVTTVAGSENALWMPQLSDRV